MGLLLYLIVVAEDCAEWAFSLRARQPRLIDLLFMLIHSSINSNLFREWRSGDPVWLRGREVAVPRGADQGEQRGEYRPSGPWGRGSATVSGSAAKDVRGVVGGLPLL